MDLFTGWQYLLIDCANHYGLDKDLFPDRIQWVTDNLKVLESLADKADKKPLYLKAVMAIRKAQAGLPTGHLVSLDACCSGIQVMSALTGCITGATHTGLVDPNVRADAYTTCTVFMNQELGGTCVIPREDAKSALMKSYYGSKKVPRDLFGKDTVELSAFYTAAQKVSPGSWELLQDLLASWQPYTLEHSWKLPDGFDAIVKVMDEVDARIEVDELAHTTFSYHFYENKGMKEGLSNVANVVHSVDAYILRCMHRRCNYKYSELQPAINVISKELNLREECMSNQITVIPNTKLAYYIEQYDRSGMADIVIIPYLKSNNVNQLSTVHLAKLLDILHSMLAHQSFEIVTIHDEFKCHANNMNYLRQHYINIFAELADSNVLSDILSQIHGKPGTFKKLSNNLSTLIRGSNYALT